MTSGKRGVESNDVKTEFTRGSRTNARCVCVKESTCASVRRLLFHKNTGTATHGGWNCLLFCKRLIKFFFKQHSTKCTQHSLVELSSIYISLCLSLCLSVSVSLSLFDMCLIFDTQTFVKNWHLDFSPSSYLTWYRYIFHLCFIFACEKNSA